MIKLLAWFTRITGLGALVLGLFLWQGHLTGTLRLHMTLGALVAVYLAMLSLAAGFARVRPPMALAGAAVGRRDRLRGIEAECHDAGFQPLGDRGRPPAAWGRRNRAGRDAGRSVLAPKGLSARREITCRIPELRLLTRAAQNGYLQSYFATSPELFGRSPPGPCGGNRRLLQLQLFRDPLRFVVHMGAGIRAGRLLVIGPKHLAGLRVHEKHRARGHGSTGTCCESHPGMSLRLLDGTPTSSVRTLPPGGRS